MRLGRELHFDKLSSELSLRNETFWGTSLAVQWLRLLISSAGNMGLIPGWGTKILYAEW